MSTQQISVFLENKKGRLAEVTRLLAAERINIRALALADTADFGILRLIVNDPDRCARVLKSHGVLAQETEVIAVEVRDQPGGLDAVLHVLEEAGINIEYMYAFVEKRADNAMVVFKVDDAVRAVAALRRHGVPVADDAAKTI